MGDVINPLDVLYAIVEETQIALDPRRFVIAYRSESSLCEFLVPSCIVATGYRSREEAAQRCDLPALSMAA